MMTNQQKIVVPSVLCFILLGLSGSSLEAEHPCTSPLVLDLNGNRVAVSHPRSGADFDINGDGVKERIGWPVWDAFLWVDLDHDGVVTDGSELFGTSTLLPSGEYADNGFEALAVYDRPDFGGDGNGVIKPGDLAWAHLRLWQDTNRDGISQRDEITSLAATGVAWIGLDHELIHELDGGGNHRIARGLFGMRHRELGAWKVHEQVVDDVLFAVLPHEH